MTEEFVTFEIAEKLKEKGYNKPFYFYYRTDDELIHHVNTCAPLVYSDKIDDEVVIAPTTSQVLKWLREEKGISLNVYPSYFANMLYWTCDVISFIGEISVEERLSGNVKTYEKAAIYGLEYVLDNLI